MKSLITIIWCLIFVECGAWSGHQCPMAVVENVFEPQCLHKHINCDPLQSQLKCCMTRNITVSQIQVVTRCCPGHQDEMCNITSCLSCNSSEICDFNQGTCLDAPPNKAVTSMRLAEINRGTNATVSDVITHGDTWWTNTNGFNQYRVSVTAIQAPSQPVLRQYQINVALLKKLHGAGDLYMYNRTFSANIKSTNIAAFTPFYIFEFDFNQHIDHGDVLRASVLLSNTAKTFFLKPSVSVLFDFVPPAHCLEHAECGLKALHLSNDASKVPINLTWDGWSDSLSRIGHFNIRIYKLLQDKNGYLRQPSQPSVIYSTNGTTYTYNPKEAGVYSFVLSAEDKAGNQKYARKLGIYDPDSNISTGNTNGSKLFVSSSNPGSNYTWQTEKSKVVLNWTNHFVNWVHVNGSFLNKFVKQPLNGVNQFVIQNNLDDNTRSTAISNINGIIKFEYGWSENTERPPGSLTLVTPLSTTTEIDIHDTEVKDKEFIKVWVKATDIMGNQRTDTTRVYFDTTPPYLLTDRNISVDNTQTFTSKVNIYVTDLDSGIDRIDLQVTTSDPYHTLWSGSVPGNKTKYDDCKIHTFDCDCGNSNLPDECYYYLHVVTLDHCKMLPPPSRNTNLNLNIQIYNNAQLAVKRVLQLGHASQYGGLGVYDPPGHLQTKLKSAHGVRLSWTFNKSCYNRTAVVITSTVTGKLYLSANKTWYDIEGLQPASSYKFEVSVLYGDVSSIANIIDVQTDSDLPVGYVVGLVLEGLVIVLAVVILLVYRHKRRSTPVSNNDTELAASLGPKQTTHAPADSTSVSFARLKDKDLTEDELKMTHHSEMQPTHKPAYEQLISSTESEGEPIYEDINHDNQDISRSNIKLEDIISEGQFSTVHTGTIISQGKENPVAIKCPSQDMDTKAFTDTVQRIMEFTITKVEKHENILNNICQVVDKEGPPMLVMEMCDEGCLSDWLQKINDAEPVDIKPLHHITIGIASGMDYLISKGIVHGNLCSRNILLNADLVPKIKGFGPNQVENRKKNDKWLAPEYLGSILESLDMTEAADVWAYGVVCWEIYSLGEVPYENIEEHSLLKHLQDGNRLSKPEVMNLELYDLVNDCFWKEDPNERPTFYDIKSIIDNLLSSESDTDQLYTNT